METQNKKNYAAPEVKIVELPGQGVICTSDYAGTESMGRQSESDWD